MGTIDLSCIAVLAPNKAISCWRALFPWGAKVALYCSISYYYSSRVSSKSCQYCSIVGYLAWVSLGVVLPLFWLLRVRDPKSNKSISTGVSEIIIVFRPFSLSAVLGPPGIFGLGAMF
jgi:hypothetical protein